MEYYKIRPEVPGHLGPKTIYDKKVIPWLLRRPQIIFDGWLGGDLLKISSCYLVSQRLKTQLEKSHLSGINGFNRIEIELSDSFKTLCPDIEVPVFYVLEISEKKNSDFYLLNYNKLIISKIALKFLNNFETSIMEIEEFIFE